MTLPPGSFWLQPGGEMHLDRCSGDSACILLVQVDGPWDSIPATE
jgi:hypothetical protein